MEKQNYLLFIIILGLSIILFLTGCKSNNKEVFSSLLETPYKNMYYDTITKIVYYIPCDNSITVYYAENGLPYRFNPMTKELEIISPQGAEIK